MNNNDGQVWIDCPMGNVVDQSIARSSVLAGRAVILVSALTIAVGCASKAPVQEDVVSAQLDKFVEVDGTIRHDIADQEVARLWQESEIFRQAGDGTNARATLQEAIQLAPKDAVLWSRAAELELDLNANLRAENYAAKSNILTTVGNRPLQYRNWLIIQRAREGRGDLLGAREAEIESRKLNP